MNLPPIRTPGDCCGGSSSGTQGDCCITPEEIQGYVDCAIAMPRAAIVGTPPATLCTNCDKTAGQVIARQSPDGVTLEIEGQTDTGAGPFEAPVVRSVTTVGTDVKVVWGPDNNDASISLTKIRDAIAMDAAANALVRIAVCNADQFASFANFNGGGSIKPVSIEQATAKIYADNEGAISDDLSNTTSPATDLIQLGDPIVLPDINSKAEVLLDVVAHAKGVPNIEDFQVGFYIEGSNGSPFVYVPTNIGAMKGFAAKGVLRLSALGAGLSAEIHDGGNAAIHVSVIPETAGAAQEAMVSALVESNLAPGTANPDGSITIIPALMLSTTDPALAGAVNGSYKISYRIL